MNLAGRELAIEYFIKSLSSGELSAAQRLEPHLADDVEYDTNSQPGVPPVGREHYAGKESVLYRVSGQWPATPGYLRLAWSDPVPDGDDMEVTTSSAVTARFSFNAIDQIRRVVIDGGFGSGLPNPPVVGGTVEEIPLAVRALINNSRLHQTPILVTYVDGKGVPHASFRGSTYVIRPTQVSIWVRDAHGGLASAVAENPHLSLVYCDYPSTGVIDISGIASISSDAEVRRKAYELTIESEQHHDIERKGVAVIVEVTRMSANIGEPRVRFSLLRS
jgi:hypothetical protein